MLTKVVIKTDFVNNDIVRRNLSMYDFIIIDDDTLNNALCIEMIQEVCPGAVILAFNNPENALAAMLGYGNFPKLRKTIVFLDLEMPELSGWGFLDKFHRFPEEVKIQFKIFILSSFIYTKDRPDSIKHQYVSGYIAKPLTRFLLQETIQHKYEFFV